MTGTLRGMCRLSVNCPDAGADWIWIGRAKHADPGTPDVTDNGISREPYGRMIPSKIPAMVRNTHCRRRGSQLS